MKRLTDFVLYGAFLAIFVLASLSACTPKPMSCEDLKSIEIPNVTITNVTAGIPGYELSAQAGGLMSAPARKIDVPFCRVEAYSEPTSDSHIGIEVWLPDRANWNEKFLAAGNPGFIGSLSPAGLAPACLRQWSCPARHSKRPRRYSDPACC